jgi:hypothetical protein
MSSKAEAPANSERTAMTHITIEKEKLEQILEALDNLLYWDNGKPEYDEAREAITVAKQALEQPAVQETVEIDADMRNVLHGALKRSGKIIPPPAAQRQWVKLTPEDIKIAIDESGLESHEYGQETIQLIYAIDAKLEEKNTAAQPAPVTTREIDP